MEMPCKLQFTGSPRNISWLKQIFEELGAPCVTVATHILISHHVDAFNHSMYTSKQLYIITRYC